MGNIVSNFEICMEINMKKYFSFINRIITRKTNKTIKEVVVVQRVRSDYICNKIEWLEIINKYITPVLAAEGYHYNGDSIWYTDWNNHQRKVISIYLLKGYSAVFSWGLGYDFIPVISGNCKTYSYYRTDHNIKAQLHVDHYMRKGGYLSSERPYEYTFYKCGTNKEDIEERLHSTFILSKKDIDEWFEKVITLDMALDEVNLQLQEGTINYPKPHYLRAFFYSAKGETDKAVEEFKVYCNDLYAKNIVLAKKIEKQLLAMEKIE